MSRLAALFLLPSSALFLLTSAALAQDKFPDAPGKPAFLKVCGGCHGAEVVIGIGHDRQAWQDLVEEMVDKGATATAKEVKEIVDYLAKAFPKRSRQ